MTQQGCLQLDNFFAVIRFNVRDWLHSLATMQVLDKLNSFSEMLGS
jgi:hypothetical protein